MIVLEKSEESRFQSQDRWPLLFAIADIFKNHSSEGNPLSVERISAILRDEYGIGKVDRHAIKDYRLRLEKYFGYQFGEVKRKGFFLKSAKDSIGDRELLNIAIAVQSFPYLPEAEKQAALGSLYSFSSNQKARMLIDGIDSIRVIRNEGRERVYENVRRLLKYVKPKRKITVELDDSQKLSFYPQFIFVKNNEYFLFGMIYEKLHAYFASRTVIANIRNIINFEPVRHSNRDPYQKDADYLTVFYPYEKSSKKIPIADIIKTMGKIEEVPMIAQTEAHQRAKIAIHSTDEDHFSSVLDYLKKTYSYGDELRILRYIRGKGQERSNKPVKGAIIHLSLPEEDLFRVLFVFSEWLTLLGPKKLKERYKRRLIDAANSADIGSKRI